MKELIHWASFKARAIASDEQEISLPPQEGVRALGQLVLARSFTTKTKGYIERVVEQINGAYENGHYDACSVMIRRLVETLIIESFESKKIDSKIKGPDGHFLFLSGLVDAALKEHSDHNGAWNLSRNAQEALKAMKKLGDLSAHNRRYNAHRSDIDNVRNDLRITVQELVQLADIQRKN